MATDEAPFLTKGVEVSAKYKGAYCEAKVKHVEKLVKCKVVLKESGKTVEVLDEAIRGTLKVGAVVQVRCQETSSQYVEGVLSRIHDQSMYTVVFDDGDENRLKRTKLCPKGARHFMKSDTLDHMPLTHPERFGTPVVKNTKSKTTSSATTAAAAAAGTESDSEAESSGSESGGGGGKAKHGEGSQGTQDLMGRVVCVEVEDRSRKSVTVPALVVLPSADDQTAKTLPSKQHVLLKSFRDNKFLTIPASGIKNFESVMSSQKIDKILKFAFDKAKSYVEKDELPPSWDRNELLGYSSDESSESDEESQERNDCFLAQLYKFMDDRGTPINKVPSVDGKDISLSKLSRVVQALGGHNRVTNHMKWHVVCRKLQLSRATAPSSLIRSIYKRYLQAFDDLNRKLGCTMESTLRSDRRQPYNRSLVSFRERERGERDRSPKSTPLAPPGGRGVKEEELVKSGGSGTSKPSVKSEFDGMKPESIVQLAASKSDIIKSDPASRTPQVKPPTKHDRDEPRTSIMSMAAAYKGEPDVMPKKSQGEEKGTRSKESEGNRMTRAEVKAGAGGRREGRRGRKEDQSESGMESEKEEKVAAKRSRRNMSSVITTEDSNEGGRGEGDGEGTSDRPTESEHRSRRKSVSEDSIVIGSKLKVKYGKDKHQKVYEAKVLDVQEKGGTIKYRVHYSGWNSRYDEWVLRDVIQCVIEEPADTGKAKPSLTVTKTPTHHRKISRSNERGSGKEDEPRGPSKTKSSKSSAVESMGMGGSSSTSVASKNTRVPVFDMSKSGIKPPGKMQRRTRTRSTAMDVDEDSDDESSDGDDDDDDDDDEDDNDDSSDDDNRSSKNSPPRKPRSPASSGITSISALSPNSPAARLATKPGPLSKRKELLKHSSESEDGSESETEEISPKMAGRWRNRKTSESFGMMSGAGDASSMLDARHQELGAFENKRDSLGAPDLSLEEAQPEDDGDGKPAGERPRSDSLSSEKQIERMPALVSVLDEPPVLSPGGDSDEGTSQDSGREETAGRRGDGKWGGEEGEGMRKRSLGRTLGPRQAAESASRKPTTPGRRRKPTDPISESPQRKLTRMPKETAETSVKSESIKSEELEKMSKLKSEATRAIKDEDLKSLDLNHPVLDDEDDDDDDDDDNSNDEDSDALPKLQKSDPSESVEEKREEKDRCFYELISDADDAGNDAGADDSKQEEDMNVEEYEKVEEMPLDAEGLTVDIYGASEVCVGNDAIIDEDRRRAEAAETLLMSSNRLPEPLHGKMMTPYHDSPPDSSLEASPSSSVGDEDGAAGQRSNHGASDEQNSTKSEREANMEVEAYMRRERRLRGRIEHEDSPSGFEFESNDESGSSDSARKHAGDKQQAKQLDDDDDDDEDEDDDNDFDDYDDDIKSDHVMGKGREKSAALSAYKSTEMSDSDEGLSHNDSLASASRKKSSHSSSKTTQRYHHSHKTSHRVTGSTAQGPTVCKYNFLDMEDGKYLEGDERIAFISKKIQEVRAAYMALKAEVACIDRRRKRHRGRERRSDQFNESSTSLVTSAAAGAAGGQSSVTSSAVNSSSSTSNVLL